MKPSEALKRPQAAMENIKRWADTVIEEEPRVLKVGDKVRVRLKRSTFAKGYQPRWTQEVFTVKVVYDSESKYRSHRYLLNGREGRFTFNDLLYVEDVQTNPQKPEKVEKRAADKLKASGKRELRNLNVDLEELDKGVAPRKLRTRKAVNYSE